MACIVLQLTRKYTLSGLLYRLSHQSVAKKNFSKSRSENQSKTIGFRAPVLFHWATILVIPTKIKLKDIIFFDKFFFTERCLLNCFIS